MSLLIAILCCCLFACPCMAEEKTAVSKSEGPSLQAIERTVPKEPKYASGHPLYALYLFGPKAQTQVWAVLDKSLAELKYYDVLYFDRNANGDLTDPEDRILGEVYDPVVGRKG